MIFIKLIKMCTLVQVLRLCRGNSAHTGIRGRTLVFLDHGNRRGWGVSVTPRPLFTTAKNPVPHIREVGWVPEPDLKVAENLTPTGIRFPERPPVPTHHSYKTHNKLNGRGVLPIILKTECCMFRQFGTIRSNCSHFIHPKHRYLIYTTVCMTHGYQQYCTNCLLFIWNKDRIT